MFFCSSVMYVTCLHLSPFKLTVFRNFSILTPCPVYPLGCKLFWRQKEFLFDFVPQLLTGTSYTIVLSEWSILPLWPLPFFYPPPSLLAHLVQDAFPRFSTTFALQNEFADLLKGLLWVTNPGPVKGSLSFRAALIPSPMKTLQGCS